MVSGECIVGDKEKGRYEDSGRGVWLEKIRDCSLLFSSRIKTIYLQQKI